MNNSNILFNVSIVFLICICIALIVAIRYVVVLWFAVKKARKHFNQLEPKIHEITEHMISIENKVSEIENTPLVQQQFTTKLNRYGKIARTVLKSQSKYRTKKMQKQEKKLKKRLKNLKNQTKKYQKR